MTAADRTPSGGPAPGSPEAVLVAARDHQRAIVWGEAGLLASAVEWASMHEPTVGDVAFWWESGTAIPLAGAGAPEIAEFAVAEFAAAVGLTSDAGRRLIGHGLELCHRLPRLWGQVQAGRVPVWRARRVAEVTCALSPAAAAYVDGQVAAAVGKVSLTQLDHLVTAAKVEHEHAEWPDPDDPSPAVPDSRRVDVHTDQVSFAGTVPVIAELDLVDALHLDQALATGAEQLALGGSTESLDARRATSLGELSRTQLALTFDGSAEFPSGGPGRRRKRPATLYLHLSEAALTGGSPVGRCENTRTPISVESIRAWCAHPDATVTIKPVLDLTAHLRVDQYELPDRLKEEIDQRNGHCVFPWCTRPASGCDHDHAVPYDHGEPEDPGDPARGPTCSCNVAPLCRHHHRLKTHTPWRYRIIEQGVHTWTSPHGYQFLVDATGTRDVTPPDVVTTAGCPSSRFPDQ